MEQSLKVLTLEDNISLFKLPETKIVDSLDIQGSIKNVLNELFDVFNSEYQEWISSINFKSRTVDVFDSNLGNDEKHYLTIVRAIAVPLNLTQPKKGKWVSFNELVSRSNLTTPMAHLFLFKCHQLMKLWLNNTTFIFELLPSVFSIHDLRSLLSLLTQQDIDPGNFHRRLKKLNILKPYENNYKRIHKWQFCWNSSHKITNEGLLP